MKKNNPTVGIEIEGGSDITVQGNQVTGFDKGISAKNVTRLDTQNNSVVTTAKTNFWSSEWIKWVGGILGTLIATFIAYKFGWK